MKAYTKLRLALLANGYTPLANRDKACYLEGWPKIEVTETVLRKWDRSRRFAATGIRIENGLAVIDMDIDHKIAEDVLARLEANFPALASAPLRHSGGDKFALFVRTSEPFGRLHSRRWIAPGENADEHGAHAMEIFGGTSPRQFGAFGPHTVLPNGEVTKEYAWDGDDLTDVSLAKLPEFTKSELATMVDKTEELLEQAGFEVMLNSKKGENDATRVYDLTSDMDFNCVDEVSRTLSEMRDLAGTQGMRCSAEWLDGYRGNASKTRCILGQSHSGHMTLWDSATGDTHMEASLKPKDRTKGVQRLLGSLSTTDSMLTTVSKLIGAYGLCTELQPNVVVPFDPASSPMSFASFRLMLQRFCEVEIGPRGGEKRINPADIWAAAGGLVLLGGRRMRPDMERPLYVEHGVSYINTYEPVQHATGGDAALGVELLTHLLPDARERAWFTQWLAYKWTHPWVPGPAVVMVAREQGTGRGTMGELLKLLFGPRYVQQIQFDIFAGRSYQSQYNDWGATSLMVLVNESSTADNGGSIYRAKHDTYEHLKELIDPRPMDRFFVCKGEPNFTGPSHTSYFIATNNPDALPIPAGDRRFAVLSNGDIGTPGFWDHLNEWMEHPGNIGAFAQWLESVSLAGYQPFVAPPATVAKQTMAEMAKSDLDVGFAMVLKELPGKLIVLDQIFAAMRQVERNYGDINYPDGHWENSVARMVRKELYRVGDDDWRLHADGKKHVVYARSVIAAGFWSKAPLPDRKREVLMNGSPAASRLPGNMLAGMFNKKEKTDGTD